MSGLANDNKGNVLFLILIAVALFAALSYAVTSSVRTGETGISKDKSKAYAAAIIQYGGNLRNAIMRMKVSNGCTDTTLDFSNNVYRRYTAPTPLNSANANAPSDKRCNLFDANGGNMIPLVPPAEALVIPTIAVGSGTTMPGHGGFSIMQIKNIGTDGVSGDEPPNDIVFSQNFVSKEVCVAINDLMNVENPGGDPPSIANLAGSGSYTNGSLAGTLIVDETNINGFYTFCILQASNSFPYKVFQIMVAR